MKKIALLLFLATLSMFTACTQPFSKTITWRNQVIVCSEKTVGKLADGRSFIICLPADAWNTPGGTYDKFRVVIGSESVDTLEATRYRDGGTTIIQTTVGTFFFPAPGYDPRQPWEMNQPKPDVRASFENKPLKEWHSE